MKILVLSPCVKQSSKVWCQKVSCHHTNVFASRCHSKSTCQLLHSLDSNYDPLNALLQIMIGSPMLVMLLLLCRLVDVSTAFHVPKPSSPRVLKAFASLGIAPPKRSCTARPAIIDGAIGEIAQSLLRSQGQVPVQQAFALNAFLFAALSPKLLTMLTPTGFAHAFVLGTSLWHTIGWKGWTLCVLYLFCGQAVTKVKFAEKEKKGIAEGRGGRRGPGGVW